MLEGYLRYQRRTLLNICAGLTPEQLALRPLPSTNLSLLGLVRHLAKVERIWLRIRVGGEAIEPLFDPELGKDYDFEHVDAADARAAFESYAQECRLGDLAAASASFDDTVEWRAGTWSVRMVYVHMIGEYARHNGHADLLREAIDGVTNR
jgi:uncharacterized damage-inducible protein DinB